MPRASNFAEPVPDTGKDGALPLPQDLIYQLPASDGLALVQPVPADLGPALAVFALGCGMVAAAW